MQKKAVSGIMLTLLLLSGLVNVTVSLHGMGVNSNMLGNEYVLLAPDLPSLLPMQSSPTPGYYETSEYLIGSVAIGVIFLESNGAVDNSTEDWNSTEEALMVNAIQEALDWWKSQNPSAGVNFTLSLNYCVPTSYEPINRNAFAPGYPDYGEENLWISEAMTYFGYSGDNYFTQVRDFVNALRQIEKTDWAFVMFIVDASNDPDGRFPNSEASAYAYLGGPFLVMPYWPPRYLAIDNIVAHEMGHIFYATDEYNGVTEISGYLGVSDVENSGCLMYNGNYSLSAGTWGQVGWRDTDGDGIQDIVDTFPEAALNPYSPDPTSERNLTYTGTVTEIPKPNNNPQVPPSTGRDVTINIIVNVEFRVDGGSWINATADDGAFDESEESFSFTTPPLLGGTHTIEVRGINSVGNIEEPPYASDTVILFPVRNMNTGLGYFTIQSALNAFQTQNGHEIRVDPGAYYENIIISKMISLIGYNKENTIIDGNKIRDVIEVRANSVNITGFCIQQSGNIYAGIYVPGVYSSGNNISDNIIVNNGDGVLLYSSSSNIVFRNIMRDNGVGVSFGGSSFNTLSNNNITENAWGINLFAGSYNNTVFENEIIQNSNTGVWIDYSSSNIFYRNNFINNSGQASTDGSPNTWDAGPSGGNYWSDYTGADANSDGIGETPYVIDGSNLDNYPLIHPYGSIRNLNTNRVYLTIQSAINTPETLNGHTIYVKSGIYYERVTVTKQISLLGENRYTTVIDAQSVGNVVTVTASNVRIRGFAIRKGGGPAAVALRNANIEVTDNIISNNTGSGVVIYSYSNNTVSGNEINSNGGIGVVSVVGSKYSTILRNNISNNGGNGIRLIGNFHTISCNNISSNNDNGILMTGNNHVISDNIVSNHSGAGIRLDSSSSIFSCNNISSNGYGVYIDASASGQVFNNTFYANNISLNGYGVYIEPAGEVFDNTFYANNFADNTVQVSYIWSSIYSNHWDAGYPEGGNYWSDYSMVDLYWGPSQDSTGSDGIRDIPYVIVGDENNQDNYPLMSPYEYWSNPILGDINRDMKVDNIDLSQLAGAYGSATEESHWNPNCDINLDNIVSVSDLHKLGRNYGKTYPE